MSQQFDFLNTGNTGVADTFGNETVAPEVDEAIQEQRQAAQELLPSIAAILATLDEEIAAVSDLRAYMKTFNEKKITMLTYQTLQEEYRARELYISMVERLKQNIANKVADYEVSNG